MNPCRRYPALPTSTTGPGGPIEIKLMQEIILRDGVECGGVWEAEDRQIFLDAREPREKQWRWYFHELGHVALTDSGLSNMLPVEMQEALCDAYASARVRERFG